MRLDTVCTTDCEWQAARDDGDRGTAAAAAAARRDGRPPGTASAARGLVRRARRKSVPVDGADVADRVGGGWEVGLRGRRR